MRHRRKSFARVPRIVKYGKFTETWTSRVPEPVRYRSGRVPGTQEVEGSMCSSKFTDGAYPYDMGTPRDDRDAAQDLARELADLAA